MNRVKSNDKGNPTYREHDNIEPDRRGINAASVSSKGGFFSAVVGVMTVVVGRNMAKRIEMRWSRVIGNLRGAFHLLFMIFLLTWDTMDVTTCARTNCQRIETKDYF